MGIRKKSAPDSEEDMANRGRDGCREEVTRPKKHIKALGKAPIRKSSGRIQPQLKRALHDYHGMKETHKKRFIDRFLNMKRQTGISSLPKCLLLKPGMFPVCPMSVTPKN